MGNDTNIAGATYRLTMTEAGALGGGVSHFTAPDSRPNYTSANAQASIAFNNAQFGVVPIAEALKVSDPNNIVVSANLMPFNAGDTFNGTHTEVVVAGGLDQDVCTTFSPQPDAPGQTHGCVGGELQGSFYSWQTRCDVAQNFTLGSLYLGHGGTHTIPGAQFVTEGRFLGGADFSLENFGTAITIRPPKGDNPASGSFTQVRVLDFSVSTGVTNAITFMRTQTKVSIAPSTMASCTNRERAQSRTRCTPPRMASSNLRSQTDRPR